ncbi:MAG TPA: glycosyltransferase family 2 protein [Paludibacteraceae bacterium]|nr:glycosyltransferase family 2 protein [Paludibacteraceae bacterium]
MSKIYFVLPAYNEAENIESVINQWYPIVEKLGDGSRLVIANDGSRDDTYSIMCGLRNSYPLLVPLDKMNSGHGATLLYLYRYAIEHGAEYVFQTDSDGQTDPNEFWKLYENRQNYDFLIGYRKGRQDGFSRIVVTKVLRLVLFVLMKVWVKDSNTPFRLMKIDRLSIILEKIPSDFFLANVAICAVAKKSGERCVWYPITFKPRQGGVNSINLKRIIGIGFKALNDFKYIGD